MQLGGHDVHKVPAHRKYSIMDSFNFYFPLTYSWTDLFYPFSRKSSEAGNSIEVLGRGTPRTVRGSWQPLRWVPLGQLRSRQWRGPTPHLQGWWDRQGGVNTLGPVLTRVIRGACVHTPVSCIAMYRQVHYGWTSCWRPPRDRLDWPSGASATIGCLE